MTKDRTSEIVNKAAGSLLLGLALAFLGHLLAFGLAELGERMYFKTGRYGEAINPSIVFVEGLVACAAVIVILRIIKSGTLAFRICLVWALFSNLCLAMPMASALFSADPFILTNILIQAVCCVSMVGTLFFRSEITRKLNRQAVT